jgi:uncharacterized membrane protein
MRKLLANGSEGSSNPTSRPHKGRRRMAVLADAAQAETRLLEALREQPLSQADLIRALSAPASTVQKRLTRLEAKGAIAHDPAGLWSATSPP